MSATRRPWIIAGAGPEIAMEGFAQILWIGPANSRRLAATCDSVHEDNLANADLIVTAVNAFALLLAIARAADHARISLGGQISLELKLRELYTAHPNWRDWSPE